MTNEQVILELKAAAAEERKITLRVVQLIAECLKRKVWARRGFTNAHAWLVKEFSYAEASAARRLDAARILLASPDIAEKLEAGILTISSLSKAQHVFRHEEKRTGEMIDAQRKNEVLEKLENLSTRHVERVLAEEFPECHIPPPEILRATRNKTFTLNLTLTQEQMGELERTRELMSHSHPDATWAEIFAHLSVVFNDKNDPIKRDKRRNEQHENSQIKNTASHSAAEQPPLKRSLREKILARAHGRCEFTDPITGNKCGSSTRVQVDHIVPKALGGTDDIENLRCMCATHNRFMAEEALGMQWANAWKNQDMRDGP